MFKGAGLLAVAVVSGLVWWLVRHEPAGPEPAAGPDQGTTAAFQYSSVADPVRSTDCVAGSYGEIQDWFRDHPCQSLSRGLYVTEVEGKRALVSVALVTMPDARLAQQFKAITDTDNTGNVADLVRDGSAKIPGAPRVATGEYQSRVSEATVTIVETNFFDGVQDAALLPRIAADALLLGDQLR
ncbi:hypothetical protein CFN78_04425 [Amycolatopsis antarctica]|uniref:Uncharacterized protein n=1 Tax=Amycolatopsis antarctica TaxID=1854586 RepID=A0A263D8C9_9PSEU|nr:hypothetical protein CFN78_04425 [Amycolatopsis antarctica]